MPGFLRQSTASQSRAVGPFLDDTDFKTPETGLTIANTDIKLIVNGGASANKNSGGGTHRVNGVYGITFDATDTATIGEMEVSVVVSGALPVFDKFTVVEEAVYDAFYAASATGSSLTAGTIADAVWNESKSGHTTSGTFGDYLDYKVSLTPTTSQINLIVDAVWNELIAGHLAAGSTGEALDSGGGGGATAADIADAVWDEATAGHTTSGTFGEQVKTDIDAILVDTVEIGVAGAGLTNINLPDQVMNITGNITGNLSGSVGSVTGSVGSVTGLTASDVAAIKVTTDKFVFTTPNQVDARVITNSDKADYLLSATGSAAFTEGYRANGAAGTLPQLLYELSAHLGESSISSTTKTIKKIDHTTAAETFTLNSSTAPTSITRAS